MDCSAEESEIRRALEKVPGVRSLGFQLGARQLRIDAEASALAPALEAIRRAGFDPQPVEANARVEGEPHGADDEHDHDHAPDAGPARLGLALAVAVAAEVISYFAPDSLAWKVAGMAIAGFAIWLAGLDVYRKGIAALLRGKLNINALMSVAVTGAFLIGEWPEAAMVMALYAIAELIEAKAVDRARSSIKGLLDMAPEKALTRSPDGSWTEVAAERIAIGAIIRVKPGERVPLDALVTKGESAVNQAPITGESIPVDKAPGMPIFAGTVNQTAELEARVTAAAADTTLARIIHAVEEAQGTRAPTQRFVDRFAAFYTPAIFAIAVATAFLLPWLADATWLEALYKALVLLVIACPCALVISTPVTVVSGLSAAARRGILIKGGTFLEQARLIKAVALDKTGTITEGKPKLVDFRAWGRADESRFRLLAAALASRSDHPVSKAIATGLGLPAPEASEFKALPGRGVQAIVEGQALWLGNHRLMHERGLCDPELEAELARHESQGRTVTLLSDAHHVLALFAVADVIKESSKAAIADLAKLGVTSVMLTGDNQATAKTIADQAGISDARGDLLPEAKLGVIQELQKRYGSVGMTGDGINDAPALAQADVGFAMGGAGTDAAMEAADVVIMNDDLRRVAETVQLSRKTRSVLVQNISIALGIKAVFLMLAIFGSASMWMAVFADMGASLLVVANGLRLLRHRPEDTGR
ncbi:heavy metal translocating P-type ATPase [Ramlibacter sp. MAH-25]|uniref:P-type Zn(2+) transporter n=2 Tax=Comamonadaceae TaxID=80864 RepID=A0A6N8IUE8_9BURK|nr:heavy metal translocating P-type ATPase [Ramlibacter sp. CGMCC 1.13660]MVQ29636.1 heavy metal translocating P-type ATPase [Ramlibacter pinisoli]